MVLNQRKQEKLARRLMPNQSIRADQKKSSSHQARLPISVSPGIQAVKVVDWFDWFVSPSSPSPLTSICSKSQKWKLL